MTPDFQVPTEWLIYWSFACSNGTSAAESLQVSVYRKDVGIPLKIFSNQAGATNGVEHNYVGDGFYHLAIQSACSWRVTVTAAPGFSVSPTPSP